MSYNEKLADRIRKALSDRDDVEEKKMFKGIAFMVDDKMCINVSGDEMMCRFDPSLQDTVSHKEGFRPMMMKGRLLNGYAYISEEDIKSKKDFDYWINLCLQFNKEAKSSKKPKQKGKKV